MQVTNNQKSVFRESCESLRGLSALVPRFHEIYVKGYDSDGNPVELKAAGWTARMIQHEIDHIDGKMYTDLMDRQSLEVSGWKLINAKCGRVTLCYH
jgi:peptide deformylase